MRQAPPPFQSVSEWYFFPPMQPSPVHSLLPVSICSLLHKHELDAMSWDGGLSDRHSRACRNWPSALIFGGNLSIEVMDAGFSDRSSQ